MSQTLMLTPSLCSYSFDGTKSVSNKNTSRFYKSITLIIVFFLVFVLIKPVASTEVEEVSEPIVEDSPISPRVQSRINFITKTNKRVSEEEALKIVESAERWGEEFKLDPDMLLAIAKIESTYDRLSVSHAGALGLYQVLIRVHIDKILEAKRKLDTPEVFDISTNTYMGAKIYRQCLNKFKSHDRALLCYNGSLANPNGYDVKVLTAFNRLKSIKS